MQNKDLEAHETVYWWQGNSLLVWERRAWRVHSETKDQQGAINIMAALCWLGVSEYKFLEDAAVEAARSEE